MNGEFSAPVRAVIVGRDLGCCVRCSRPVAHLTPGWDWSVHHRRPRGMGGTSLPWVGWPANGVVLCGHGTDGCHGWVESNREVAFEEGWLVALNGVVIAAEVPMRHALFGRVLLDDEGEWELAA